MNATIQPATSADVLRLSQLVNSAYRGPEAKKGWTHEADLIEGSLRTDESSLQKLIDDPQAVILVYCKDGTIQGCVYLQRRNSILYLGMLSVAPDAQAGGIGKQLLEAAEAYAREHNCTAIQMTVISVRHELLAWYERHGYRTTGTTQPFEEDGRFGKPRQKIEFVVLEKQL